MGSCSSTNHKTTVILTSSSHIQDIQDTLHDTRTSQTDLKPTSTSTTSTSTSTSIPTLNVPLGISIGFLRHFIKSNPGIESMTTTEVCTNIVIPQTAALNCAFLQLIKDQKDMKGTPFVAPATVSHAWKYKFCDTVDVIEQYASKHEHAYMWLDVIINNQNIAAGLPQDWWKTTFRNSIACIGPVLLVLSPWNNPIPITRAWCLWEIMCALGQEKVGLSIGLPISQIDELRDGIVDDYACIVNSLANIQAQKAEAFLPSDKEMIFAAIRDTIGFHQVNAKVKDQLRDWYATTLISMATKIPSNEPNLQSATYLASIGAALRELGQFSEALSLGQRALEMRRSLLGEKDAVTASSMRHVGQAYASTSNFDRAVPLYTQALTVLEASDSQHVNAAIVHNLLATIMHTLDPPKAIKHYEQALEIFLKHSHPETATVYSNLGSCYNSLHDTKKADEYNIKARDLYIAIYGPNHPFVAGIYNNMATQLFGRGEIEEAIEQYKYVIGIQTETMGLSHPNTAAAFNNIGMAYQRLGNHPLAIHYLTEAFDALTSDGLVNNSNKMSHNMIGMTATNLSIVYQASGRKDDAIIAFQRGIDVLNGYLDASPDRTDIRLELANLQRHLAALQSKPQSPSSSHPVSEGSTRAVSPSETGTGPVTPSESSTRPPSGPVTPSESSTRPPSGPVTPSESSTRPLTAS